MAAINRASIGLVAFLAIIFATAAFPAAMAQPAEQFAPAPSPTSDGTAIDQGIAYILMLVALVLTYIIH
ncbi:arabinogalactan peptide 20 [Olea europaea subsp. europaea]|uniref:Arabinogalactan peptide 20 n=1 Tax=Olea europaea subsp. europaea TaxID=158383 RepID=A0A8S0QF68_OLEEU|nr:arabinogalactan peptide 20 [Olea europaea subsp. europaea]